MNTTQQQQIKEDGHVPIAVIDACGWGLFFIWVGIAFLANVGWGAGLLGVGVIALGVQLTRHWSGLSVDRWGLAFGICLVAAGALQWLPSPSDKPAIPLWLVPVGFVALGVAILVSVWRRHRGN